MEFIFPADEACKVQYFINQVSFKLSSPIRRRVFPLIMNDYSCYKALCFEHTLRLKFTSDIIDTTHCQRWWKNGRFFGSFQKVLDSFSHVLSLQESDQIFLKWCIAAMSSLRQPNPNFPARIVAKVFYPALWRMTCSPPRDAMLQVCYYTILYFHVKCSDKLHFFTSTNSDLYS